MPKILTKVLTKISEFKQIQISYLSYFDVCVNLFELQFATEGVTKIPQGIIFYRSDSISSTDIIRNRLSWGPAELLSSIPELLGA